ncbi:MAG: ComF family protein [Pelovirga sp.]
MGHSKVAQWLTRLLPPVCALCSGALDPAARVSFCDACTSTFDALPAAHCSHCALPFVSAAASSHLCGRCILEPPAYRAAYAAALYQGQLRTAIQRFKFHQRPNLDRPLARLLDEALPPDLKVDLLVSVPLHSGRLRQRTYNQALLLARELARIRHLPTAADVLIKRRATYPQQTLSARERRQNLRGAFSLNTKIEGKTVLLVDDVMTTGVTLDLCSRVLLDGGAASVTVAVVARAPL